MGEAIDPASSGLLCYEDLGLATEPDKFRDRNLLAARRYGRNEEDTVRDKT